MPAWYNVLLIFVSHHHSLTDTDSDTPKATTSHKHPAKMQPQRKKKCTKKTKQVDSKDEGGSSTREVSEDLEPEEDEMEWYECLRAAEAGKENDGKVSLIWFML